MKLNRLINVLTLIGVMAIYAGVLVWDQTARAAVRSRSTPLLQTAPTPPILEWYYADADRGDLFLVCVDRQATALCSRVLRTSSLTPGPSTDGPTKLYTFKLPTLPFGDHVVSVQTCTLSVGECTSGVTLNFGVTAAMKDVRGLRIVGGGL